MKAGEEQIYQVLKTAILQCELVPGTQLVELSLAEAFGVSRTPIRSVLRRLEYEYLVKIIPNRGAFVYCPTPEEGEQIFAVRRILEAEATGLAAIHATAEELDKMERLLEGETESYRKRDPIRALEVIADFHFTIIHASRNSVLIRYLEELVTLSHIILTFYDTTDVEAPRSPEEHRLIFEAIAARDRERCEQLAREHVDSIRADIDFTKTLKYSLSIDQVIQKYQTNV